MLYPNRPSVRGACLRYSGEAHSGEPDFGRAHECTGATMARRDQKDTPAEHIRQRQQPEADQEQEQQVEVEPEHARMQNQLGNQGVASLLLGRGGPGLAGTSGIEVEARQRRKKQPAKEAPEMGGDDEPVDGPLTVVDLSQSWNPGIKRQKERPKFIEPMPDDELPPEDPDFLDAVSEGPDPDPVPLPATWLADALLQPSPELISSSLSAWSRCASDWIGDAPFQRSIGALIRPPCALLQDPWARVLPLRTRVGALTTLALAAGPALDCATPAANCAFIGILLEIEARESAIRLARSQAQQIERGLPSAATIFGEIVKAAPARVRPATFGPQALKALSGSLDRLLDFQDPRLLVPSLAAPEAVREDDDPLGIDDVIAEFTGGRPDPSASLFQAAVQGAERLAAKAAHTRVQFAGVGAAVARAANLWSSGMPTENLGLIMRVIDRETAGVLQLLVEIARAAQGRTVAPKGLHTGLVRAARALTKARHKGRGLLAQVVCGILPGEPALPSDARSAPDDLSGALAEGDMRRVVSFLDPLPDTLPNRAARCCLGIAAGAEATSAAPRLAKLRKEALKSDDRIAGILGILLGACHFRMRDYGAALELSHDQLRIGAERRNALLIADASMLATEAHLQLGDVVAAEAARRRGGRLVWRGGARGPLSLLARWRPPEED